MSFIQNMDECAPRWQDGCITIKVSGSGILSILFCVCKSHVLIKKTRDMYMYERLHSKMAITTTTTKNNIRKFVTSPENLLKELGLYFWHCYRVFFSFVKNHPSFLPFWGRCHRSLFVATFFWKYYLASNLFHFFTMINIHQ